MRKTVASIFLAIVLFLSVCFPMPVSAAYENTYKNTGDQRADIIGVALTQVGYLEESGGVTKYGQWFGRPTADWCGIFISWCAEQAGVPTSVLRKNGLASPSGFGFSTYYTSSQYTPKPGDLFFTPNGRGGFSHAGIVYYVDGSTFYTLEGNTWYSGKPHGVYCRQRNLSEYVFVSPNYNGSGGSLPTSCSHSWKDDGVVKEPGCTTSGSKTQVCSKCGVQRTASISAKGHSFGQWTEKDEKQHQRTCASCNKVETKNHDEMQWLADNAGHWKECETCEGQFQLEAHSYAGPCGSKCTVCEYAGQDGHNYGAWKKSETEHWQVCTACDLETEHKPHSFATDCDEICTECGYERLSIHTYEQKADADGHWLLCTVCGKEEAKEKHIAGPEANEESAQSCTQCGYELAPKKAHIHSYAYTADRNAHRGLCACGDEIEENHSWSMEQNGCSVCGAVAEVTEDAFNWDIVWLSVAVAAFAATVLWVALAARKKKKKQQ